MSIAVDSRLLVLASASPRRKHLLERAGFKLTVRPSKVNEEWPGGSAAEAARTLASRKALAIAAVYPLQPVLAADTIVFHAGQSLGKPTSRSHAGQILERLSGDSHDVVTGVALALGDRLWTAVDTATVHFRVLSRDQIERYLDSADYMDKAGAYGIQEEGAALVDHVDGRRDTVMGLPMLEVEKLWEEMEKFSP